MGDFRTRRPAEHSPAVGGSVVISTDHRIDQSDLWKAKTRQLGPQRFPGYLGSLLHACRVALTWHKTDVLISANVRNAALFCMMRRILPMGAPQIMVLELRLDDPRPTLPWRAKRAFQRFAMAGASLICVSAKREIDLYAERLGMDRGRFRFIPWHTNVLSPALVRVSDGYVFSAGRTGRDWRTLLHAVRGLSCKVVIVCAHDAIPVSEIPENVEVLTDVSYQRYRELLEGARVVVVPLEPHVYSSGQVAFLEAMAMGKPVIATDCVGTEDYIQHEQNGLLVPQRSPEALRHALNRLLSDQMLEQRLATNGLASVLESHTLNIYVSAIIDLAHGFANR